MQKYYILLEIVQFDEVEGESTIADMRIVKSKGITPETLKKSQSDQNIPIEESGKVDPKKRDQSETLSPSQPRRKLDSERCSNPIISEGSQVGKQSAKNDGVENQQKRQKFSDAMSSASPSAKNGKNSKIKSYYPKIEFDTSSVCSSILTEEKTHDGSLPSHKYLLGCVLREVCATELKGLTEYFSLDKMKNTSISNGSRDSTMQTLKVVLTKLVDEVESSCQDGIEFAPELTTSQLEECLELQEQHKLLQIELSKIDKYQSNFDEFYKDYDIWVDDNLPDFEQRTSIAGAAGERAGADTTNQYDGLLLNMEKNCKRIIAETADIGSLLSTATLVQNELYANVQKTRIDTHKPQDLLRGLQRI